MLFWKISNYRMTIEAVNPTAYLITHHCKPIISSFRCPAPSLHVYWIAFQHWKRPPLLTTARLLFKCIELTDAPAESPSLPYEVITWLTDLNRKPALICGWHSTVMWVEKASENDPASQVVVQYKRQKQRNVRSGKLMYSFSMIPRHLIPLCLAWLCFSVWRW